MLSRVNNGITKLARTGFVSSLGLKANIFTKGGMEKGSEYRYAWPYKLVKVEGQEGDCGTENAVEGHGSPSLPTTRHDSVGGTLSSEVSGGSEAPDEDAEKDYFLKPLAEDPVKPKTKEEKAKEKAKKKKYIGDDVITDFLQDPLTTILYGSRRHD